MSIFSSIPVLGGLLEKLADRLLPDKGESRSAQSEISKAEISGGPASILRLWRGFVGWVLGLCLAWEIMGRMIIIPIFFPDWGQTLPPSALKEIMTMLLSMMGLGF